MNVDNMFVIRNILNKNSVLKEKFLYMEDIESPSEIDNCLEKISFCSALLSLSSSIIFYMEDKNTLDRFNVLKKIFQDIEEEITSITEPETENDFEICFFESLLNSLANESEEHIETLSKLLGPKSRELCIRNDEFWGTKLIR